MEVDFDLSNTFIYYNSKYFRNYSGPLLDRMEIIEVSGYTYEEKYHIAKEHLILRP